MKNKSKKEILIKKIAYKYIHIHYTKQSRLKWRWVSITIYFVIFLFFIATALMFTLGGLKFNPDSQYTWQGNIWLFAGGICCFVISTILMIVFSIFLAGIFNESRFLYFATDHYKNKKLKYMKSDLSNLSKKEIKWLYKLKYIDRIKYEQSLKAISITKKDNLTELNPV